MTQIKSPTRYMVILGRTYADGTEAGLQDRQRPASAVPARPLSGFGKPYKYVAPPVDANPGFSMTDKPQDVINAMDASGILQHAGES